MELEGQNAAVFGNEALHPTTLAFAQQLEILRDWHHMLGVELTHIQLASFTPL